MLVQWYLCGSVKTSDKLTRKASAGLGRQVNQMQVAAQRRMVAKLSSMLGNKQHPMQNIGSTELFFKWQVASPCVRRRNIASFIFLLLFNCIISPTPKDHTTLHNCFNGIIFKICTIVYKYALLFFLEMCICIISYVNHIFQYILSYVQKLESNNLVVVMHTHVLYQVMVQWFKVANISVCGVCCCGSCVFVGPCAYLWTAVQIWNSLHTVLDAA